MTVAIAAPAACKAGIPSRPKIKTAFNTILITTEEELTIILIFAWPLFFMMQR